MILRHLALIGCFRVSCMNSYQLGCNGKQMSTLPTEFSTSVNSQSDAVNWSDGHFAQCICGVWCALRMALFGSSTSGVTRCKGGDQSSWSPHSSLFFSLVFCFIMELHPLTDRRNSLYNCSPLTSSSSLFFLHKGTHAHILLSLFHPQGRLSY